MITYPADAAPGPLCAALLPNPSQRNSRRIDEERRGADGLLSHGEMEAGQGVIMVATPTPDYQGPKRHRYQGPKRHREQCEAARRWSAVPYVIDGVLVHVDDIDAHYERAKRAGAHILSEPEDTPFGRRYRAEDLEGHRWMFVQRA
jgi:uncharacterized glyoxalase superfamily protein PhnB